MTQDIPPLVRSWLDEAFAEASEPVHIYPHVAARVHQTPQQRGWLPPIFTGRSETMFSATKYVVAGVIVALAGGFLLTGVLTNQQGEEQAPAAAASASASPDATALQTDGPVKGTGPVLTWESVESGIQLRPGTRDRLNQIFSHGDGFVIFDADDNPYESADGLTWTPASGLEADAVAPPPHPAKRVSSGDMVALYDEDGRRLQVTRPDGSRVEHTFRGPIWMVAVSPAGIVVIENLTKRHVIEDVLGADVAAGDWSAKRSKKQDPGIWSVRTASGETSKIVLAKHGFGHLAMGGKWIASMGWHSTDGVEWTAVRDVPLGYDSQIFGTAQGFFWSGDDDGKLRYSADGLAWKKLGRVAEAINPVEWGGGLLVTDGGQILLATPDGLEELPMSETLLGPDGPLRGRDDLDELAYGLEIGGLGLVEVFEDVDLIVYSPDGSQWSLSDVPAAWSAPSTGIRSMAVGNEVVMVKVDRCSDPQIDLQECYLEKTNAEVIPALWRGTVRP